MEWLGPLLFTQSLGTVAGFSIPPLAVTGSAGVAVLSAARRLLWARAGDAVAGAKRPREWEGGADEPGASPDADANGRSGDLAGRAALSPKKPRLGDAGENGDSGASEADEKRGDSNAFSMDRSVSPISQVLSDDDDDDDGDKERNDQSDGAVVGPDEKGNGDDKQEEEEEDEEEEEEEEEDDDGDEVPELGLRAEDRNGVVNVSSSSSAQIVAVQQQQQQEKVGVEDAVGGAEDESDESEGDDSVIELVSDAESSSSSDGSTNNSDGDDDNDSGRSSSSSDDEANKDSNNDDSHHASPQQTAAATSKAIEEASWTQTTLWTAAESGDADLIRRMRAARTAHDTQRFRAGSTAAQLQSALDLAVRGGHAAALAELLLFADASHHPCVHALALAANKGDERACLLLLPRVQDTTAAEREKLVRDALSMGQFDAVKVLLRAWAQAPKQAALLQMAKGAANAAGQEAIADELDALALRSENE